VPPPPGRSRRAQHLTKRAGQLGFASLQAYLVDRVTRQAWPLTQVANELGIDRNTVRDRLDRHGLRLRRARTAR
jgi:transcriptional regulator of acetoin/glycerol metabolism